jgi:hypothetical protein
MTQTFGSASANFTIVLPGTWANIPLHDRDETQRAVAALVKRQVGKDDRLARLRRDAKTSLTELADKAVAANALGLSLWLELVPGMPFPGSLVVENLEQPASEAEILIPRSDDERAAVLAGLFPDATILDLGPGPVARSAWLARIDAGESTVSDLKIVYSLLDVTGARMLRFVVDLPTVDRLENYVDLFDLVIDSVRWIDDADSASADPASVPEVEVADAR